LDLNAFVLIYFYVLCNDLVIFVPNFYPYMTEIKRIFDIPYYQLKTKPLNKSLVTKYEGVWASESSHSYIEKANKISSALLEVGIQKGDKIAIISNTNRSEWHITDIGIQQIGAIVVPIYPNMSINDDEYIFHHADIRLCFFSDKSLLKKICLLQEKIPTLKQVYSFDKIQHFPHWDSLLTIGSRSNRHNEVKKIKDSIKAEDIATIIYTSGTTGKPKGVMLSHKNIVSNVLNSQDRIPPGLSKALSFLPVCHVFERMITYLYQKNSISIYFAESMGTIADDAQEIHPHIMTVVPRFLEKMYDKIVFKGQSFTGIQRKLFFGAVDFGKNYTPFKPQSFIYSIKLALVRKLIFNKWKNALGGDLKIMVSGGAALQTQLAKFFIASGIPVLEGYGLSETSPVISVNSLEKGMIQPGTVGKPIKNVQVKLADDGEVLVKGDNVMTGYYKDPQKTAKIFTKDGYFKTGDIGELTPGGLLKLIDRKNEMFKTSGGKYIAPQPIENKIRTSRFIAQIMVAGAAEKMPCAFIQPDFEFLKAWIKRKGHEIDISSREEIISHKTVKNRIQKVIDHFNSKLGRWEQIKKFTLIPDEWSVESGCLTPTMKLRRKIIKEKYQALYEKMYNRRT